MSNLAWVYHNVNPYHNSTGDCAIRAIAKYEGLSWEEVYKRLFEIALKTKTIATDHRTVYTYFTENKYEIKEVSCKLKDYIPLHKRELLLLKKAKGYDYHLICCENGNYFDDRSLDGKKWRVVGVYAKKGRTGR